MKKIITSIVIIIISFITINVYAEDTDTWNESYEHNGIKYSINGFTLNIYKSDANFNTDMSKATYQIPLKKGEYTINPTYIDSDIKSDNKTITTGSFIKLNLNITEEQVKKYLVEKIGEPTDAMYTFTITTNYTITEVPEKYLHIYTEGFAQMISSLVSGYTPSKLELNKEQTQVIGAGSYSKEFYLGDEVEGVEVSFEGENETVFQYSTSSISDFYSYNYLRLREKDITEATKNNTGLYDISADDYIVMFHNKNDIEKVINNFQTVTSMEDDELTNNIEQIKENTEKQKEQAKQTVKVGNTASSISNVGYIIGAFILLLGTYVIIKTIKTENKKTN